MKLALAFTLAVTSLAGAQDISEQEVLRFDRASRVHRTTRATLTRRDAARRRRARQHRFSGELERAQRIEREERRRAIVRFEAFLERHPDHPAHTPAAMFRLGHLYYERSLDAEDPDFGPTIELYRRLVRDHPAFDDLDAVLHLLGVALERMGAQDEAKRAWLRVVCVDPSVVSEREHYGRCQPRTSRSRLWADTWLRVGELHFDDVAPGALDWAISAYAHALAEPRGRIGVLASYKTAWAHYRASRYAEAIRFFGDVAEGTDELRAEALQYIAICFAYDDWNENQLPDEAEGMPSPHARVADPRLLPQNRDWTAEVYIQLGKVFFDEAKYPEAVRAWREVIRRWPLHPSLPEVFDGVNEAMEQPVFGIAVSAPYAEERRELDAFDWTRWIDHQSDLERARRGQEYVEEAMVRRAIREHQRAQQDRRRAVEAVNAGDSAIAEGTFASARAAYARAAESYRAYLATYPNAPDAYELRYNLADALYWGQSYDEAATAYADVRDSLLGEHHRSAAGRRAVESIQRLLEAQPGLVRDGPPPVVTGRVTSVPMPQLVQRLARARDAYLHRVTPAADAEGVRAAYAYNNALLLFHYGHWEQARRRLSRVFRAGCENETGRAAWELLYLMASERNDRAETDRLSRRLAERTCTFSAAVDGCCGDSYVHVVAFRHAKEVFERATAAADDTRFQLFEEAASLFIQAVDENPSHPDAPVALEHAAIALERTGRLESSRMIYQRILDTVGPLRGRDDDERTRLDRIVANAIFRMAYQANRLFDDAEAREHYRSLADSPRFASSNDELVRRLHADAIHNLAVIHERHGEWSEAERFHRRLSTSPDVETARVSAYRLGEIAWSSGDRAKAVRAFNAFISRFARDRTAASLLVRARWRIAQAREGYRSHPDALRQVVGEYARLGLGPSDYVADHAAEASFRLADRVASFSIHGTNTATLRAEIESAAREARAIAQAYEVVMAYRQPRWTARALVAQGRAYEALERAITNARAPRALREQVAAMLDEHSTTARCLAREQYLRAAHIAPATSVAAADAFSRLSATPTCAGEPPTPFRSPPGLVVPVGVAGSPPLAR